MPRGRGQARAGARRSARGDTDACSEDELGGSAAPSSAKRAGVALAGRPDSRKRQRGRGQDSADAGDPAAQMIAADAGDPAAQMIERTDLVVMVHGRQMPRYATRQGHGLNCLGRVQDRHTRL